MISEEEHDRQIHQAWQRGFNAGLCEASAWPWRDVASDPAKESSLATFFDNELGEWVYTTFREGPVRSTLAAPYTQGLPLDIFNSHPLSSQPQKGKSE